MLSVDEDIVANFKRILILAGLFIFTLNARIYMMIPKTKAASIKKTLTYLVVFVGVLNVLNFVYAMGAIFEYHDVYRALEEIKDLENRNLLQNPPESISKDTKEIMQYFQNLGKPVNSITVEEYMHSADETQLAAIYRIFILAGLFIFMLIARICMIFLARFKSTS
jgi:hypothetical protein